MEPTLEITELDARNIVELIAGKWPKHGPLWTTVRKLDKFLTECEDGRIDESGTERPAETA